MRGGHGAEAGPVGESGWSLAPAVEWVSGILSSQQNKVLHLFVYVRPFLLFFVENIKSAFLKNDPPVGDLAW